MVVLAVLDGAEAAALFVPEEDTTTPVLLVTTSNALDRLAFDLLEAMDMTLHIHIINMRAKIFY